MDAHTVKITYNMYKLAAQSYLKNKKYLECLMSVKHACRLAYAFNWKFTDEELEDLVYNIAQQFNIKPNLYLESNRIVFYDNFAIANRGLTQQYIRGLIKLGYEILLIITKAPNEIDKKMQSELASYANVNVEYVPLKKSNLLMDQIRTIIALVTAYKPARAFMHMMPWDVVGNVAWNALSFVERYQINLTDHAFWLGTKCSDYVLEFRNYGYNLSRQMRYLAKDKLLMLPYYPIYDIDADYEGIPEPLKGAVKLFSGGAVYKILGNDFKFIKIINNILLRNPNTIFYFAGAQEQDVPGIISLIKKQGLRDRWVFLGNRRDIAKVMEHMDIYIGTYPIGGGLMTQIAAAAAKPVMCYQEPMLLDFTNIEQLFHTNLNHEFVFATSNLNEFNNIIDELIHSSNKRSLYGKLLQSLLLTRMDFENELRNILKRKRKIYEIKSKIPVDAIFKLYIDIDNNYLHNFYRLNINLICFKNKPLLCLRCIVMYCYYNWKQLPCKILRHMNKR